MALIVHESVCQSCNCEELNFSELTGIYNATSNPGGYGSPNVTIDDVTGAILTVILGDGTSYNIDIFTDSEEQFPTSDTTDVFTIPNEDIGYITGDKIPDQLITFIYTITFDDGTTSSSTITKLFSCQTKCCVLSMLKKIDFCCDDCSSTAMNNFIQAWVLYNAMLASAGCADSEEINKQLSILNKICGSSGCGCS